MPNLLINLKTSTIVKSVKFTLTIRHKLPALCITCSEVRQFELEKEARPEVRPAGYVVAGIFLFVRRDFWTGPGEEPSRFHWSGIEALSE